MAAPCPTSETTPLTCAAFTVPLAADAAKTEPVVREVYEALGLDTVEYVAGCGARFVVPTEHIRAARQEIDAGRVPRGDVRHVIRTSIDVPHFQPQVAPTKAAIYRALGIDTVNIDFRGTVYTVLTSHIYQAKAQLARGDSAGQAATSSFPTISLEVRKCYVGPPPPAIAVAVKLYGAKFVRILAGPHDTVYWVLVSPLYPVSDVLDRLGAYV